MVSIMPPRLQVPNNLKFKFFVSGQVQEETFTPDEFVFSNVPKSNHMGEQKNQHQNLKLRIIALHNSPKVFERSKNLNLIVEDVHALNFKRKKNF
jgi:hypothetical protein